MDGRGKEGGGEGGRESVSQSVMYPYQLSDVTFYPLPDLLPFAYYPLPITDIIFYPLPDCLLLLFSFQTQFLDQGHQR